MSLPNVYITVADKGGANANPSGGGHEVCVTLDSIEVTPADQTLSLIGYKQMVAIGTYSDSTTLNLTSAVTWSSSDEAVVTITSGTNGGFAQAVGIFGEITISATVLGVTGFTPMTVSNGAGVYTSVANGSNLQANPSTGGNFLIGLPIAVPADAQQVRLRIFNRLSLLGTGTTAVTGVALAIGKSNAGGTDFQEAPTIFSGITIPADGDYYLTDWFTPEIGSNGKIFISYCIPAGSSVFYDPLPAGFIRYDAPTVSAYPLTGVAAATNVMMEVNVEIDGYQPRYTVLGDSISVGYGTSNIDYCCWRLLQTQEGVVTAIGGTSGGALHDYVDDPWLSDWINVAGSHVIIELGVNDLNGTQTLQDMKDNYEAIVATVLLAGALDVRGVTVVPSTTYHAQDSIRVAFNTWLLTLPAGILSVADVATAVQDPGDHSYQAPSLTADGLHLNDAGHAVMLPVILASL